MIKKTVTYKDYNGVERTEDFYFNLTKAEVSEMEMGTTGGFAEMLQKIIDAKDQAAIIKVFKEMVLKAYGEKSADGRSFLKEDDFGRPLANKFKQTEAYSDIFMELAFNTEAATAFVKGIIPSDLADTIKKLHNNETK